MRINTNPISLNTHRQLTLNTSAVGKSVEKLSSGFRINRAADDAAGLAISEKMLAQIRGLNRASMNAQDGVSMIQSAEAATSEVSSMLLRIRELAIQGSNEAINSSSEYDALKSEITQLSDEINRIVNVTQFNGKTLFNSNFVTTAAGTTFTGAVTAGATAGATKTTVQNAIDALVTTGATQTATSGAKAALQAALDKAYADVSDIDTSGTTAQKASAGTYIANAVLAAAAKLTTVADIAAMEKAVSKTLTSNSYFHVGSNSTQVSGLGNPGNKIGLMDTSLTALNAYALFADAAGNNPQKPDIMMQKLADYMDKDIDTVNALRSNLGAIQNRLESTIRNLDTISENISTSQSRIRDLDMAKGMTEFTKNNIMQQAATAMLAQANSIPQTVLQLLR